MSGDWHTDYEDRSKADGIILLGYGDYLAYRVRLEQLVKQGTHFVRWGAVEEGQPGLSIGSDNFQGGYDVTRHLIAQSRRNIAFLGNASSHYPEFFARYRGYEAALKTIATAPSPTLQCDAISSEEAGYDAAHALIERAEPFDAVLCASDLIAIGALRAFHERGIDVPNAVSVAGFDDIPAASHVTPPLTTVMQDTRLAGEVLVETLLKRIRGEEVEGQVLPTRLAVRESCGAGSI
jgi:DNA-binding LacI/PurR family transcriptional regulator